MNKESHKPMETKTKRAIFFTLLLVFLVYTFFIATSATEYNKGISFSNKDADKGKMLFQDYNCGSCHQIYGLGGHMGPDLTNVMSGEGKGENYVKALLKHGTQRMPNFHLSEQEINSICSYLYYIDKTGISPVTQFTINKDGSVNYPSK